LKHLLGAQKLGMRKDSCWVISHILAVNQVLIQSAIDAEILPTLLDELSSEVPAKLFEDSIRKEALWAIGNATARGTPDQAARIGELGFLPVLCQQLPRIPDSGMHTETVYVSLHAILCILMVDAMRWQCV
jgi:importin subunit alpha-1